MSSERCSPSLLGAASSMRWRSGGAGSRACCSIHIGPNCTTCVAPAQNGERNTRGPDSRGKGFSRGTMERIKTDDLHSIRYQYGARLYGRRNGHGGIAEQSWLLVRELRKSLTTILPLLNRRSLGQSTIRSIDA